ncbi:MAG TPA: hypothetical protein PLJ62_09025 [Thermoflexales bacterium]|nr:hypothetical protein [Thermoflexales bacterium]HQW33848.1 hypothetical protein [Thermoflexales bacterium]HQZ21490.1 hypothetical protein [Thermoflexales bacterium]HRA00328.1 hypothetical protein [Thermoflexales bacterium]
MLRAIAGVVFLLLGVVLLGAKQWLDGYTITAMAIAFLASASWPVEEESRWHKLLSFIAVIFAFIAVALFVVRLVTFK